MGMTQEEVLKLFNKLSSPETQKDFFASVADDVNWFIAGSTKMSGTWPSKKAFTDATLEILNNKVLAGPLCFKPVHVIAGADGEWANVEMEAMDAKCKNGMPYDMRYCWNVRFGSSGKIEQVRAYIDTDLLAKAMEQNQ